HYNSCMSTCQHPKRNFCKFLFSPLFATLTGAHPAPRGGGGCAGHGDGGLILHLHEFQDRSPSLVPAEHRFLPALGPFVPSRGGASGGGQVGPRRVGPLAAMPTN